MAKKLQLRGGTTSEHSSFTGAVREVTVDTDKDTLVVHDGSTAGGIPLAKASEVTNKLPLAGGTMTGTTAHGDNVKATYGASADLQIYHDGSHTYITENGTGDLKITGNAVRINAEGNENGLNVITNGAVNAYYDNNLKLATTSTGIDVTGNVVVSGTVDGVDIASRDSTLTSTTTTAGAALPKAGGTMTGGLDLNDNVKARFGDHRDLEIYHNAGNSIINEVGTGSLYMGADADVYITNSNNSETKAQFTTNGACTFYWDNAVKLATSTSGIGITGNVDGSGDGGVGYSLFSDSAGMQLAVTSNHYLAFKTNNTERVRIHTDGVVQFKGGITEQQVSKSASFTPSFAEGTIYNCTASLTVTMPTATAGKSFTIIASTPPSWSGTIKWSGGSAPTGTGIAIYTFISNGTNWYGMEAGSDFA